MPSRPRKTFLPDEADDDRPEDDERPDDEPEDAGEEESTGGDDQIDDPIRIYLMQMGEIPMLTRQQETTSAKHIQASRERYRYHLLATDYMLQAAIGMLESIRDGKLRLDRTIEVSVINLREKRRLLRVLDPNLRTLHNLMQRNRQDFAVAFNKHQPRKQRRQAWRRLVCRRGRAVRLVEELGLRTQRLQPAFEKLKQISLRMDDLQQQLAALGRGGPAAPRRAELHKELCYLMRITLESPATLRRRVGPHARPGHATMKAPSATSRPAICGWSFPSPSDIAIAA